ncbi:putative MFS family arabinose efflux permease [Hasllibacter halocynthiae]|uniref:Putative MFS family arabinose efflux permease n=1 Tax=Hasllibacter halocynthiae TaxID=595589 RepID=A0A2T0X7U8_9RHOB|nr:MFS transporter [Hasllibacter halocynthiae]PRY95009.1 putative MFS family arabinose efflux permease [Hasllibacter halocynthiae]
MLSILKRAWALYLGIGLLMVGNGLQGSLLGVRGAIEGFTTQQMSYVMSGYFAGFLVSASVTPIMIRRVGHVRVFAALGSLISAVLILYPALTDWWLWLGLRVVIGFCFCGVYVTAESWLNNVTTTANRGSALSLYMVTQMAGIVSAQGLLAIGDPSGFILFIVPSVLVSLAFAPILLSVNPAPSFETTKPMSLAELWRASPLGTVGMALIGLVFAAQFGMTAVYGTLAGFTVAQISLLVGATYVGGLVLQFPIGWASDMMDRRVLILGCAVVAVGGAAAGLSGGFAGAVVAGAMVGGLSNPIYALLIAYVNDHIEYEDMPAASGRLLFVNGLAAVAGPVVVGSAMNVAGPTGFWWFLLVVMAVLAGYTGWRMTRRPAPSAEETGSFAPIFAEASAVTWEAVSEEMEETSGEDEERAA